MDDDGDGIGGGDTAAGAFAPRGEDPREPSMKAAPDVIVLATPPNAA